MDVLNVIILFAIICMADQLRRLYRENKIKKLVSWVVVYNTLTVSSHDMPLWQYIHNAQRKSKIQEEYRISSDEEWRLVKEIIQELQNNLMQSYFKGHLGTIKSKYEIRGEHYFMLTLCEFLEKHQCDAEFLGYEMHQELLEHKSYGNMSYSATYLVSDFAIVFFKLLYITYITCKNTKSINSNGKYYYNEGYIEEILKTKKLRVNNF